MRNRRSEAEPANLSLSRRAIAEAISAGDMANALRIARRLPASAIAVDARLLLVATAALASGTGTLQGTLSVATDGSASTDPWVGESQLPGRYQAIVGRSGLGDWLIDTPEC